MFIELRLDQVISESISKALDSKNNLIQEQFERPKQQMKDPKIEQRLLEKRRKMLDSFHSSTSKPVQKPQSTLDAILEDTEESGFVIADEGNVNPEFVSEETVQDLMEGKDFSKFF